MISAPSPKIEVTAESGVVKINFIYDGSPEEQMLWIPPCVADWLSAAIREASKEAKLADS
jgi:hypothetical protein